MPQSSNKRIALNTIYMYARLFITLVIGLYTSRVVLLVLGISDYGLFNIVGGVLSLFAFKLVSLNHWEQSKERLVWAETSCDLLSN